MATLFVVRHGEAEGNSSHRFIGHSQMHLTETGRRQAQALADRLGELPIERIVASDLVRCVETVEPLARRLGLEIETDPRLREVSNGEWTGLLPEEIAERWPQLWKAYTAGEDVRRPGGERGRDVAERVLAAVTELLDGPGPVVVSTHSGPTVILAMWAAGVRHEGNIFRGPFGAPHNASITVIEAGPRLVSYNDVGHVASVPDQRLPFSPVKNP